MWRFTGGNLSVDPNDETKTVLVPCEPLVGIGEGPFTDEEFAARLERYEAQFTDDQRGAVLRSGMYEQFTPPKAAKQKAGDAGTEEA